MTTPATMAHIIESLRDRISDAEREASESHKAAMNSYGAGYDRGFVDALKEVLGEIVGEPAMTGHSSSPDTAHYLGAIRVRLEQLYEEHPNDPALREQISDEVDWIDATIEQSAEPITHRWRSRGAQTWIYDPEPQWLEDHKFEIEWEPVYGAPQPTALAQPSTSPGTEQVCAGGIDPGFDECPKCGATMDDSCRFEERENTGVGGITWHSSEPDGGPDVGLSVFVAPDDRLWCGEITRKLFEEQGKEHFRSDGGWFLVRYQGEDTKLIAKFADGLEARDFIEQIATWVGAGVAQPSASPVTDAMVERAWAAIVGTDVAGMCFQASIIRADLRTALEAVISPAQPSAYANWTLHRQPDDLIVDHKFSIWSGEHPVVLANEMPGEEGALAYIVSVLNGLAQQPAVVRKLLGAFYKTVDVMKSARNSESKTMNVWADDMKAIEDVMLFLETLRDAGPTQTATREALEEINALISNGDRPTVNERNAFEHFTALNRLLLNIRDIARRALSSVPSTDKARCAHAAIISLDGKWHCQKCGDAIEMAVAQSLQDRAQGE